MNKKNLYIIRGIRMANYLIRQGCDMIKVADNKDNSNYKIFLFEDTPKLQNAITRYNNANKK